MMDLRSVFPQHLFSNRDLVWILAYCLREVMGTSSFVLVKGRTVELDAHEMVAQLARIETDLGIQWDEFLGVVKILEDLRLMKSQVIEDGLRVRLTNIAFPIGPTDSARDLKSGVIPISLLDWCTKDAMLLKGRGLSKKSAESCTTAYRSLESFIGNARLSEIRTSDIESWKKNMQSRITKYGTPMKPSSINDYLKALKAGFNRARAEGFLETNPAEEIRPIREPRRQVILPSKVEFSAVRENCPNWLNNAIDLLGLTALRRNELLGLKWQDVDFEESQVSLIRRGELGPKNSTERIVPIPLDALRILKHLKQEQEYAGVSSDDVVLDDNANRVTSDRLTKAFKKAAVASGVDPSRTLHSLRKMCATRHRENRTPLPAIKTILGHASERTTEKYVGQSPELAKDAVEKLSLQNLVAYPTK